MKSYGTTEFSILTTNGSRGSITAGSLSISNHAISRLSEREFAQDFEQDRIMSQTCSSPAPQRVLQLSKGDNSSKKGSSAGASLDITTMIVDTSNIDTRGYPFQKHVTVTRKYKEAKLRGKKDDAQDQ